MSRWQGSLFLAVLFLIAGCGSKAPQETEVPLISSPPGLGFGTSGSSCPPAVALSEEAVWSLEDEEARQILLRDRREAEAGPRFKTAFRGPRLVPQSPASMTLAGVDVITLPSGQSLAGYLDVTASIKGKEQHDFVLMLLVDGQQVLFELGGCEALAHILSLPAWESRTFHFRLSQSLSPGEHELLWLVHDDPDNTYATKGVLEKKRRDGKVTFDDAAGRPFYRPVAIRQFARVEPGRQSICLQANWVPETIEPRQADLLNTPLEISLTGDETNPLLGEEPAIVMGRGEPLYAFVRWIDFPPTMKTTAELVAILDDRQVSINGRTALRFEVQGERYYRIPFHIDWPTDAHDGRVHQLHMGVAFDTCFEWEDRDRAEAWHSTLPFFEPPVMVVPDASWIPWISDE